LPRGSTKKIRIKRNKLEVEGVKYPEFKQVSYSEIAKNILKFWEDEKIFERSISTREENETFTFFEGPPSANGTPGIHHVMARTVKDIFCRYKTLQGYQVKRKGGWDTHGLPVELQVEKELSITKDDIGKKISVEDYNAKCREAVMKYKGQWDDLTQQMGYWVDLDDPYVTFEKEYIESVWNLLKRLYDKGLLYKAIPSSPILLPPARASAHMNLTNRALTRMSRTPPLWPNSKSKKMTDLLSFLRAIRKISEF